MEPETDYGGPAINHGYLHAQKQSAALAQGRTGFDQANAIAPPMPTFFDQVGQRIQTLSAILGETNQELSMLGDRVFGGTPQTGSAGNKTQPQGAGHAGSVLEAFDMLLGAAGDIAQRARALNSRL